jgi:hypothetical protein
LSRPRLGRSILGTHLDTLSFEGLISACLCVSHAPYARLLVQGRITLKKDLLETRLQEVAASVREAGEHLTESLQPYVRPANLQRLNDTMNYFGNPEVSRTLTLATRFARTISRGCCLTGVCCVRRAVIGRSIRC